MPKPVDHILVYSDMQEVPLRQFVASTRRAQRRKGALKQDVASEPVVRAVINHGRYVANCPFCGGAELVDSGDLRFYCLSCDMEDSGRKWLPVEMPRQRAVIEAALLARPRAENRNWEPGESVAKLRRENAESGAG